MLWSGKSFLACPETMDLFTWKFVADIGFFKLGHFHLMCHYVIIILQACLMIHCNHTTIFTIHRGTCDTTSKPAPVRRMPSTHFGLRNIFNQPSMRRRTKIYCGSHQIDACTKMRASSNISCSLSWDYTIWQNIKDCKVHKFWCSDDECEFGNCFLPVTRMTCEFHQQKTLKTPMASTELAMTGNSICQKDEHFQQAKASQSMKVHEASGTFEQNECQTWKKPSSYVYIYIYRFSNTFCWKKNLVIGGFTRMIKMPSSETLQRLTSTLGRTGWKQNPSWFKHHPKRGPKQALWGIVVVSFFVV